MADDEDQSEESVPCAHCGSTNTKRVSYFGAGEMTMQFECEDCHSSFERVKWQ